MQFYIDPALLTIGPLSIYYYGLVYALGFLALYIVLQKSKLLSESQASSFVIYIGLGMMIFARLFHFLIDNPQALLQNPLTFFAFRDGGMAFFGGYVGIIVGGLLFAKFHNIKRKRFFAVADMTAIVALATIIFGRLANFINQELVGRATDIAQTPWCFYFLEGFSAIGEPVFESVCRHPYQLYASLSHLVLFVIIITLYVKRDFFGKYIKALNYPGAIFILSAIGYAVLRVFTDFWRDDAVVFVGLTSWQIIFTIVFLFALALFWLFSKRLDSLFPPNIKKHKKQYH